MEPTPPSSHCCGTVWCEMDLVGGLGGFYTPLIYLTRYLHRYARLAATPRRDGSYLLNPRPALLTPLFGPTFCISWDVGYSVIKPAGRVEGW
jgi:hypothetical protein